MKTLLSLTLAALVGSATVASAENYFTLSDVQERDGIVELGTISTDGDGIVQIYSFQGGEKGMLLGSEPVSAGANSDVRVPLSSMPRTAGIAELVVNGQVVATQRIRFEE